MMLNTLGDMRQHFLTGQATFTLKSQLNTLVQEMSSGQKSDLTAHLGADQSRLSSIDRQLELLDRFASANKHTAQSLAVMQTALNTVESHRAAQSGSLITVGSGADSLQVQTAAKASESAFSAVVNALNTRHGDRSLFAGASVDRTPLNDPQDMMTSLRSAVTGLTNVVDIEDAVAAWFDAPGGGFETDGYFGQAGTFAQRSIASDQTVQIDAAADDPAFRDTMKALALGAIAGDEDLTLDVDARRSLQLRAGEALLSASSPLAAVQARLGHVEQQVDEANARLSAQQSAFGIARNDLVSADPFETATRLQQVQQQLETQYTLTARLSRLSLTEYLR